MKDWTADLDPGSDPSAWSAVLLPGRDGDQVGEGVSLEPGTAQPFLTFYRYLPYGTTIVGQLECH